MRTFEVVLIFVNLLSLLLGFTKPSKAVWVVAAGVNLSVFLLHAVFEGFRYQMIFSYAFVILFAAYVFLVKINGKFLKVRIPKVLKFSTITLSLVLLLLTAFLAYALPVFTLSKPTGSYAVGIQYFRFVDENRPDPFLVPSTQNRELMVKVYYPALPDDSKPFSPYFHNSPDLIRLYVASLGLPGFIGDHLNLVRTNSKDDLKLSNAQPSYPVILFSHGAGTTMEVETSQSEDLASHGYIVVDVDHTYVSAATVFPDHIVTAQEATADFGMGDATEAMSQIMSDDDRFIIEKLSEMNESTIVSNFAGRLNLDEIGVIGHSLGGSVAYNLANNDSRVKAAIDLDGDVYITPQEDPTDMVPLLMLASDHNLGLIQNREPLMMPPLEGMPDEDRRKSLALYGGSEDAYNVAYEEAQQNIIGLTEVLRASNNLFTIEGSDHLKFTDVGLFLGIPLLSGATDGTKCLEITKSVTLAFFDQHLKGETNNSWASLLNQYPELRRVDLQ